MADQPVLDLEETVRQLRIKIDEVRRHRARAEVERATAEATISSTRLRLVEDFGLLPDKPVDPQVTARLAALQERLAAALDEVESALAATGR